MCRWKGFSDELTILIVKAVPAWDSVYVFLDLPVFLTVKFWTGLKLAVSFKDNSPGDTMV